MHKETADFIHEAYRNDCKESEIYEDYRGRGEDEETTGVVVEDPDILTDVCLEYARDCDMEASEIPNFGRIKQDSMGRQTILY